jgi:hypothetical protein
MRYRFNYFLFLAVLVWIAFLWHFYPAIERMVRTIVPVPIRQEKKNIPIQRIVVPKVEYDGGKG